MRSTRTIQERMESCIQRMAIYKVGYCTRQKLKERSKTDKRINRKYHNRISWSKTIIQGLQDIAFSTWKFRNRYIYGHNKQEEESIVLDKMKSKVRQEYKRRHIFPAKIQWRYFTRSVQDRVNVSIHMLQAWYANLDIALTAMEEHPFPATGIG